jgi:monothiol glutaredoxin
VVLHRVDYKTRVNYSSFTSGLSSQSFYCQPRVDVLFCSLSFWGNSADLKWRLANPLVKCRKIFHIVAAEVLMETIDKIKQQLADNPIIIYMKGSPKLPSCGFSAQASQALIACGEPFAFVDILQNPDIRAELPAYANWPTFPQLWVEGELVGGCDIMLEMFQRGELQPLIKETAAKYKTDDSAE